MSRPRVYAPVRFLQKDWWKSDLVIHRTPGGHIAGFSLCREQDSPLVGDVSWWLGADERGAEPHHRLCPTCDKAAIPRGLTGADAKALCGLRSQRLFRERIQELAAERGEDARLPEDQWPTPQLPLYEDDLVRGLAELLRKERAAWWGIQEVAARKGVAEATIRSYLARGQMPTPSREDHGRPSWNPRVIEDWISKAPGKGNRTNHGSTKPSGRK